MSGISPSSRLLEGVRKIELGDLSGPGLLTGSRAPGQPGLAALAQARCNVEAALLDRGAAVLRGFDIKNPSDFSLAAGVLCRELEKNYGDLVKSGQVDTIYDATWYPADMAILFHNEGAHTATIPTRQFFYCVEPAAQGGETPLADCRLVYSRLPPLLRRRFEVSGLCYVRNFVDGLDVSWREFFRTEDEAAVEATCRAQGMAVEWLEDGLCVKTWAPAVVRHEHTGALCFFNQVLLHHPACLPPESRRALEDLYGPEGLPRNVTFGDGAPIPDDWVGDVLDITSSSGVCFDWQAEDMVVLDNVLCSHARRAYSGPRKVAVALGDVRAPRALFGVEACSFSEESRFETAPEVE